VRPAADRWRASTVAMLSFGARLHSTWPVQCSAVQCSAVSQQWPSEAAQGHRAGQLIDSPFDQEAKRPPRRLPGPSREGGHHCCPSAAAITHRQPASQPASQPSLRAARRWAWPSGGRNRKQKLRGHFDEAPAGSAARLAPGPKSSCGRVASSGGQMGSGVWQLVASLAAGQKWARSELEVS